MNGERPSEDKPCFCSDASSARQKGTELLNAWRDKSKKEPLQPTSRLWRHYWQLHHSRCQQVSVEWIIKWIFYTGCSELMTGGREVSRILWTPGRCTTQPDGLRMAIKGYGRLKLASKQPSGEKMVTLDKVAYVSGPGHKLDFDVHGGHQG